MIGLKLTYNQDPSEMVKRFRTAVDRIENGSYKIIAQAMQDGANIMRQMISTRPSAKSGKPGRIDTGHMLSSVSHFTNPGTKAGNVSGRFGWIDGGEDYFLYQEAGFTHNRSGEWIEGMYAMQDSGDYVANKLREELRENLRNA